MQCASPLPQPTNPFAGASQPTQIAATHVGNPIQVLTGNKYQKETDLAPLPDGLSFIRHYNSRSQYHGVLGIGWRHNWEVSLLDQGETLHLWQADGRRIDFKQVGRPASGVRRFEAAQHHDGEMTAGEFGYQWQWRDGTTLDFNRERQLIAAASASGQKLRLIWNADGQLLRIRDKEERSLTFAYTRLGKLRSVTDPAGERLTYHFDANQNLREVAYPDQTRRRYDYDDPYDVNNLTRITVSQGEQQLELAHWRYDNQDRALSSERPGKDGGIRLRFLADGTEVTDANGVTSRYNADSVSGIPVVSAIHGPGCRPCGGGDVSYAYNERMQIQRIANSNGDVLEYEYDELGRLNLARASLDGAPMTAYAGFSYVGETELVQEVRTPSVKPGSWRSFAFDYGPKNQITAATERGFSPNAAGGFDPISRTQRFLYDQAGKLSVVDGYLDGSQDLLKVERAGTEVITRFADGGYLSILSRDAEGRPTRIATDAAPPMNLHYGEGGSLRAVSRGDRRVEFAAGLNADAERIRLPVEVGHSDVLKLAAHFLPHHLRKVHRQDWQDEAGHVTSYLLDDFGRKALELSPDRGIRGMAYNGNDQLVLHADANGNEAEMHYLPSGALHTLRVGDFTTRFDWTGEGARRRLAGTVSSNGDSELQRDPKGRVIRRTVRLDGRRYVTRYQYDDAGSISQRILPDGTVLNYRYDANGNLQGIEQDRWPKRPISIVSGLNDETSQQQLAGLSTWTLMSGPESISQHRGGKLSRLAVSGMHDLSYRYTNGLITGIDNYDKPRQRFKFDKQGRLEFAVTPQALFGYRYAPNGNRIRRIVNGVHEQLLFAADSNRLLGLAQPNTDWVAPLRVQFAALSNGRHKRVTDDEVKVLAGGEITQLRDLRIEYNANGQPSRVYKYGKLVAEYRYNHRAERIEKKLHGPAAGAWPGEQRSRTTQYLYEDGQVHAEIDETGNITRQYLYLGRHPVAILEPGARYAVHTNHLGAPIVVTTESGAPIWRALYAPFGEAIIDDDVDGDGKRFTMNLHLPGQYFDAESGLHYNLHRYYDPMTGRYISPDPLGIAAGPNPYVYANNDPINFVDPSGLLLFAFDGTGNNLPPEKNDNGVARDISNVARFYQVYRPGTAESPIHESVRNRFGPDSGYASNPHAFYISGPGTDDARSGIHAGLYDSAFGETLPRRISRLADDFFSYIVDFHYQKKRSHAFDIDVVGFSRGAASARVFANLMDAFLEGRSQFVIDRSRPAQTTFRFDEGDAKAARRIMREQCISAALNFLGLWDTVPHYYYDQDDDLTQLDLSISPNIGHVAHAVSVNENREAFHGISIHDYPERSASLLSSGGSMNTRNRVELGFIGAHSDIGGGYAEGDLSDVAFMWMLKQAGRAAVESDDRLIRQNSWHLVDMPVVHDSVGVRPSRWAPFISFEPGRRFKYLNNLTAPEQRRWHGYGMNYEDSLSYFDQRYMRTPGGEPCGQAEWCDTNMAWAKGKDNGNAPTLVGLINEGDEYSRWLKAHYGLDMSISINPKLLGADGRPLPASP